jgi:hypothetical protein
MQDVYFRLAKHLQDLIMGYPYNEAITDLLKEMYSPVEAQVAVAIPNNLAPLEVVDLETITVRCDLPRSTVSKALQTLSDRNMLYTRTTTSGEMGYALLQVGYGIPQTFFWAGQMDERAQRMAKLALEYFSVPTTQKVYGGVPTKSFKYTPANMSMESRAPESFADLHRRIKQEKEAAEVVNNRHQN